MTTHKSDSVRDKCKDYPIYCAFRKYGESLVIETVLEGDNEYCLNIEYKLRPEPKIGWNLLCGGQRGSLGTKASIETRRKQSESRKGVKNHFYGKSHSQESKDKISKAKVGKVSWSEDQRLAMSAKRKGVKKNLSAETRARMSAASSARRHTDESKRKQSEAKIGLYLCWNGPKANKELWACADKAYEFLQQHPDAGERKLSVFACGKDFQCKKLLAKLRSGWNPSEDESWLAFKANYEKERYGTQPI
jgi:hypothetical protein